MMRYRIKPSRLTLPLSLLLLLQPVLFACSEAADTAVESTDAAAATTPVETDRSEISDNLPDVDYEGAEFNILCRTEWAYEFSVEEQTGDLVSDAIYERNSKVEDRFNVDLVYSEVDGSWGAQNTFLNTLNNSILAGDGAYDLVAGYQAYMITPAMEGYFLNILDLDYIDASAPWWSKQCNDSITVNGKLYLTTGDIAISLWENIYVMFFNKQLAEEYNFPDLYELVESGEWTYDKLNEISSMVGRDLDGNGVYNDSDLYGFATASNNHARLWQVAFELPITTLNDDGFMEMSLNCERTQEALIKLVDLYKQSTTYKSFEALDEPGQFSEPTMFIENRALIVTAFLGAAEMLRDMDTDFGIIPYPKYDENQTEYRTTAHNSTSMICFPKTVVDVDMSAIIAEAMCAESYRSVIPKYYEVSLKTKISRDEQSERMIDLIRDSLIFDFGWVHSVPMDSVGTLLAGLITSGSTDFASKYATKEPKVLEGLAKINEAYE